MFRQDLQMPLYSFPYGRETGEILGFREGHGVLPVSDCQVSICTVLEALYRRHLVSFFKSRSNTRQIVSKGRKKKTLEI